MNHDDCQLMCGFPPLERPRPLCGHGHPHPRAPARPKLLRGLRVRVPILRLRGVPDPVRAPAHARAHSRLIPRIIAHGRRCYTRHATRTTPAALGPLRATRRLLPSAWPHKPLLPPAMASPHARCALFSCSGFPPSSRLAVFQSCVRRVASHPLASTRAHAVHCATLLCAKLARARTHASAYRRPTANDATCGPPAWQTGSLHDGGIRSVRSPSPSRVPLPPRAAAVEPRAAAAKPRAAVEPCNSRRRDAHSEFGGHAARYQPQPQARTREVVKGS